MEMRRLLPLVALIAFLVGCSVAPITPNGSLEDVRLLTDKTCDKPCVLGITPGATTPSVAWTIASKNPLLSNCVQQDFRSQGGVWGISCNGTSVVNILFEDGSVGFVSIAPSYLSLGRLIALYGPPDALEIFFSSRPDEATKLKALLIYGSIQAQVTLAEESGDQYELQPSTQVEGIIFNSQTEQATITAKVRGAWKGYGAYSP
jgi:hypothetical protein